MSVVSYKGKINASANKVWKTLRKFSGVEDWIASVATTEVDGSGVGATRILTTQDGAQIHERLESIDHDSMTLTYAILESPLPLENYVGEMKVDYLGEDQSELQWRATFEPTGASEEECRKILTGIFNMGIEGLNDLHGG